MKTFLALLLSLVTLSVFGQGSAIRSQSGFGTNTTLYVPFLFGGGGTNNALTNPVVRIVDNTGNGVQSQKEASGFVWERFDGVNLLGVTTSRILSYTNLVIGPGAIIAGDGTGLSNVTAVITPW